MTTVPHVPFSQSKGTKGDGGVGPEDRLALRKGELGILIGVIRGLVVETIAVEGAAEGVARTADLFKDWPTPLKRQHANPQRIKDKCRIERLMMLFLLSFE